MILKSLGDVPGLVFDEAQHKYTKDGKPVPGVTTILRPLSDFSMVPPATLKRKQQIGTAVHLACEWDDIGELDDAGTPELVMGYVQGWRRFKAELKPEILNIESKVYSSSRNYAGTLDRILKIRGARWLVDIKTSAQIMAAVGPQTAAYAAAGGQHDARRGAVQLLPDGTYKFVELTGPNDWQVFLACLEIHNFLNKR